MFVKSYPEVKLNDGATRQVLADSPDLMVVSFRYSVAGSEGGAHSHPHVQSTYIERGRFRFHIGEEQFEVSQGDSFVIPANAMHGCVCLEPGVLIDSFTPRRDDFL